MRAHHLEVLLERALAFAHAALEEPSASRMANARYYALEALSRLRNRGRLQLTLGEARLIGQLRNVLEAADLTQLGL
jgi:hypothetical protein